MALLIKDNCELCDACILDCPNEAIEEGDPYIIDASALHRVRRRTR